MSSKTLVHLGSSLAGKDEGCLCALHPQRERFFNLWVRRLDVDGDCRAMSVSRTATNQVGVSRHLFHYSTVTILWNN